MALRLDGRLVASYVDEQISALAGETRGDVALEKATWQLVNLLFQDITTASEHSCGVSANERLTTMRR